MISEKDLNTACQAAADMLGVNIDVFKRAVYDNKQREYDRKDVEQWFRDQGYRYTDDDVDQIMGTLRREWDSSMGTWDNIESAYYNNYMDLPAEDDDDDGE